MCGRDRRLLPPVSPARPRRSRAIFLTMRVRCALIVRSVTPSSVPSSFSADRASACAHGAEQFVVLNGFGKKSSAPRFITAIPIRISPGPLIKTICCIPPSCVSCTSAGSRLWKHGPGRVRFPNVFRQGACPARHRVRTSQSLSRASLYTLHTRRIPGAVKDRGRGFLRPVHAQHRDKGTCRCR